MRRIVVYDEQNNEEEVYDCGVVMGVNRMEEGTNIDTCFMRIEDPKLILLLQTCFKQNSEKVLKTLLPPAAGKLFDLLDELEEKFGMK